MLLNLMSLGTKKERGRESKIGRGELKEKRDEAFGLSLRMPQEWSRLKYDA